MLLRTITRTFRISPEYDKVLTEEAEKHSLSVSALLNQIIRQYILITRFTEKISAITLPYQTFEALLERINDKDLVEVAERTGTIIPEEAMLQRGKALDFDTVSWFMDVVHGRYNNWFEFNHSVQNDNERFHLSHRLNRKWSTYLGAYMDGMFTSILGLTPTIELRPHSVTLYLPKRSTSSFRPNPSK